MRRFLTVLILLACGITVAPFVHADNGGIAQPVENALFVEQDAQNMPLHRVAGTHESAPESPKPDIVQMLLLYVGIVVATGYLIRFAFAEADGAAR